VFRSWISDLLSPQQNTMLVWPTSVSFLWPPATVLDHIVTVLYLQPKNGHTLKWHNTDSSTPISRTKILYYNFLHKIPLQRVLVINDIKNTSVKFIALHLKLNKEGLFASPTNFVHPDLKRTCSTLYRPLYCTWHNVANTTHANVLFSGAGDGFYPLLFSSRPILYHGRGLNCWSGTVLLCESNKVSLLTWALYSCCIHTGA
jgi:hypothetical protein